ncbi:MAG: hypothetical protein GY702_24785 [Desulfobulbaceae bacterium]|nr:hypothetical protein [Desulfobulbaceae bacterium]
MKVYILAFIIAFSMVSTTSYAMEVDGNKLQIFCAPDNKEIVEVGICKGLLTAVVSSFDSWPYCEIEIEGGTKILAPFCDGDCEIPVTINLPNERSITQVRDNVIKYLAAHPENLHYPSYWLARQALHEAYGIKKAE